VKSPPSCSYSISMGETQSKGVADKSSKDVTDNKVKGKYENRLPVVEEMFVQDIAYKCGVGKNELDAKKETYLQRVEKNPKVGFEELKDLYRSLSGQADDKFMIQYVDAIFRAFDTDKNNLLTIQEFKVGFFLLLLLPQVDKKDGSIDKKQFHQALEIIYRLYDQDGNNRVTEKEIGKISSLLSDPVVTEKFAGGVHKLTKQIDKIDLKRYEGGMSLDDFQQYFSNYL